MLRNFSKIAKSYPIATKLIKHIYNYAILNYFLVINKDGMKKEKKSTFWDICRNIKHPARHLLSRPFRRPITGLVLNVSFWPELEHKMAFVYSRKDDVAVASF